MPQLGVHRPPASGGRYAGNSGYIDVSVDVAFRDTGLEQVVALGIGVHARPLSLLVSAGGDVSVDCLGEPASVAAGLTELLVRSNIQLSQFQKWRPDSGDRLAMVPLPAPAGLRDSGPWP